MAGSGGAEGRRYPSPVVKQDLAKLGKDPESRRSALGSLRAVVEEHLQGSALPRFLHQLEESAEGRRHAAAIVADLARVHGDRLSPHINRLVQILAHTLLASAATPCLQADCAKAVVAIAKHSTTSPTSAEEVLRRLCLSLIALLPHKVELLSAGAAACLGALVESETWKFAAAPLVSKLCLRAAMALANRSAQTVPHMSLLRSLASANASALAQFSVPLIRLLTQDILLSSSASWQLRFAAIHLLESLLRAADRATLASQLRPSVQTLGKCRLDKMPHVRKAAMNALRTAEALASDDDIKRRLAEDLPQQESQQQLQTEPISPLRHSLESIAAIEDLFKPALSSPRIQHSHTLFLSPRTLADLRSGDLPFSKQLGQQTPPSDLSPGRATDDSDYFCAYFYDTKEKVSCRKIVHHIHDTPTTATATATPPASPPRNARKVAVPPLPLSGVVHNSGQARRCSADGLYVQGHGAVCTPVSVTRHVTVLDSHEELLASCERALQTTGAAEEDGAEAYQAPPAQTMSKMADDAEESTASVDPKAEAAHDLTFVDKFSKSRNQQISAEQHMLAMEDLQDICDRLLEMREGTEEEKRNADMEEVQPSYQARVQGDDEDHENQTGNLNDAAASRLDINQAQKGQSRSLEGTKTSSDGLLCCDHSEGVKEEGSNEAKEDLAGELAAADKEEEAAETSSGEWSVRDNPIADTQSIEQAGSDPFKLRLDSNAQEVVSSSGRHVLDVGADGITLMERPSMETIDDPQPQQISVYDQSEQETLAIRSSSREETLTTASYEEEGDEEETLESSKQEEILETEEAEQQEEGEAATVEKKQESSPSSSSQLTAGIDAMEGAGLPHINMISSRYSAPCSSFLLRSTACVIPIAIITLAKLVHLEFLGQHAFSDQFMPPT